MLILTVGMDPMILSSRCSVLRIAGHTVVPASSIAKAVDAFPKASSDLVLLCHSVPLEDRDRLTAALRAISSRVPIYTVGALSYETERGITDGLLSNSPQKLINQIKQAERKPETFANIR